MSYEALSFISFPGTLTIQHGMARISLLNGHAIYLHILNQYQADKSEQSWSTKTLHDSTKW